MAEEVANETITSEKLAEASLKEQEAMDGVRPSLTDGDVEKGQEVEEDDSESEDSESSQETGKKKKREAIAPWKLFRFAKCPDCFLMLLGALGAILLGVLLPCHFLIFGRILNVFVSYTIDSRYIHPAIIYGRNNCTFSLPNTNMEQFGHFCSPQSISGFPNATEMPMAPPDPNIAALVSLLQVNQSSFTDCSQTFREELIRSDPDLTEISRQFFLEITYNWALIYLGLSVAAFLFGYAQNAFWNIAAYRQGFQIRQRFFRSLMYQDISWYDVTKSGSLSTRLADDIEKIQSGMGEKLGLFLQYTSTFLAGYVIGFAVSWQLTLAILSILPLILISGALLAALVARLVRFEQKNYASAGSVAEEVLSAIRTVIAFGGEEKEIDRYGNELKKARKIGIIKSLVVGSLIGALFFILFSAYALAFGVGSILIADCIIEVGDILTVFLSVLVGTFSLGQALPEIETFAGALGSAAYVFRIIDRKPEIDVQDEQGEIPKDIQGNIEFKNVNFSYPARRNIQVLSDVNFKVEVGQTLALVGPSGCGKSTTVQLLQRFYDPTEGQILIDGKDIRGLNLQWLRSKIGIVSQEPLLFATTVAENISYGRKDVTQTDIEKAAKAANAHDFIMSLPDKYETLVGNRGTQMSGGQKQRIAIARALVRDPKILLLDEATSALDNESEAVVQAALDKAREGRTTIVIAHRLSTIRTADLITSINMGRVVESGTHSDLMSQDGLYRELVMAQIGENSEDSLKGFKAALVRPKKLSLKMDPKSRTRNTPSGSKGTPTTITPYSPKTPVHNGATPTPAKYSPAITNMVISDPEYASEMVTVDFTEKQAVTFSEDMKYVNTPDIAYGNVPGEEEVGVAVAISSKKPKGLKRFTKNLNKMRGKKNDEDDKLLPPVPVKELIKLNLPDWHLVLVGVIAAGLVGALFPSLAVVLTGALGSFGSPIREVVLDGGRFWAGMFMIIAAAAGLLNFISAFLLGVAGERLTKRLRLKAFKAMLRQDMAWFDDRRHQPGALTARLAVDASEVKGATGLRFGTTFQLIIGVIAAIIVAFTASWELSFVVIAFLPLIMFGGYLQIKLQQGRTAKNKELFEAASQIATESFENVRTVQSFGLEVRRFEAYVSQLRSPVKWSLIGVSTQGIVAALAQCIVFLMFCVGFILGSYLMSIYRAEYDDIFRVFIAVVVTSLSLGRAASFAGDLDKAKIAAARLFKLFATVPPIDVTDPSGDKLDKLDGTLVFDKIEFTYPTREEVQVLKKLNLTVQSGQTVALVGPSGCGKSTIVSLLERFYDPEVSDDSSISLDGKDLRNLNLKWLRSKIGIVSQEPVLFDRSIAENIRYGDNEREVTDEEVEIAAKSANIHNFIVSLPQGYRTNVGARGTQLSGGQKQRIAIARALVRDPKILLLDEATSALDTESEKIVQDALDRAQEGRTSIVIAHRLSTIQNADLIAVVHDGKILESGTHAQLMSQKGAYYLMNTVNGSAGSTGQAESVTLVVPDEKIATQV